RVQQERLLVLRMRYDLGLPVQAEPYFALSSEERALDRATLERLLLEEQARATGLGTRLAAAQDRLAAAQQSVAATVLAASAQPRAPAPLPVPDLVRFDLPEEPEEPPAAPPEGEPDRSARPAAAVGPVVVRGSEDHSRVGRALFFAGRYDAARRELEVAVSERGDLVDLVYLARAAQAAGDSAGRAPPLPLPGGRR